MEALPTLIIVLVLMVVLLFVGIIGGIIYDKVEELRCNQSMKQKENIDISIHNDYLNSYIVIDEQSVELKLEKYQLSKEDKKFRKYF